MFLFRLAQVGISTIGVTKMVYANTFERYQ
jgi:hypothetical protein